MKDGTALIEISYGKGYSSSLEDTQIKKYFEGGARKTKS